MGYDPKRSDSDMATLLRICWRGLKAAVAAVLGAVGIEICHQFKWYPEKELADLFMATPSHIPAHVAL
jgi:hypothetical protein